MTPEELAETTGEADGLSDFIYMAREIVGNLRDLENIFDRKLIGEQALSVVERLAGLQSSLLNQRLRLKPLERAKVSEGPLRETLETLGMLADACKVALCAAPAEQASRLGEVQRRFTEAIVNMKQFFTEMHEEFAIDDVDMVDLFPVLKSLRTKIEECGLQLVQFTTNGGSDSEAAQALKAKIALLERARPELERWFASQLPRRPQMEKT